MAKKKPNFSPYFGRPSPNLGFHLPLLDVTHCRKLSSHAITRKTYDLNLRKLATANFIFILFYCIFFKSAFQLTSYTISGKTNDPILRELSAERTERQTEESDFIRCCPTNVKHPKINLF